jgi:hypothetical protein
VASMVHGYRGEVGGGGGGSASGGGEAAQECRLPAVGPPVVGGWRPGQGRARWQVALAAGWGFG